MIEFRTDWGVVSFTLGEYVKKNKINKNQLAKLANLQDQQLEMYCSNEIQRPDLFVLARICYILECQISDIMEYTPPEK